MAINKVTYGPIVMLDLTGDTVTPETLVNGTTAHDHSGNSIQGSLVIQKYYSGSTEPSSSLGSNGDIYLKV